MKSSKSAQAGGGTPPAQWSRAWPVVVKAALGLAAIGGLAYLGRLDIGTLWRLGDSPGLAVAAVAIAYVMLPLGALRWGLVLKALGLRIPFGPLFHFESISLFFNLFL